MAGAFFIIRNRGDNIFRLKFNNGLCVNSAVHLKGVPHFFMFKNLSVFLNIILP